jgi:LAS superfamily LD-carboxypeptidase LdcB
VLKLRHYHNHKSFYVTLMVVLFIFAWTIGVMYYYSAHGMNKAQAKTQQELEQIDNKISEIKKKKLAELKAKQEAEKKAKEDAERKKAADEALAASLRGQAVTPAICAVKGAHGNPSQIDVVINKKRCFNPINFVPSDLTSYRGFVVSAKIVNGLTQMLADAQAGGHTIGLTSAYRSYSNQVETYNNWVRVNGSYAAADTVSARPGYSEHQTGFAVDLSCAGASLDSFTGKPCHVWLQANAHKYGFIQRYMPGKEAVTGYNAESWHWRYVGESTATDMKNRGIHTLEELWGIQGGGY